MNERLIWEAYACLKDLGIEMSYNDFCTLVETLKTKEVKANEFNIESNK